MPAARPMVSRTTSQVRSVNVVMDDHVHRAQISVGENEPIEAAVKRFRREVSRSGHLPLLRARKTFHSTAEVRQNILKKEARRLRFILPAQRPTARGSAAGWSPWASSGPGLAAGDCAGRLPAGSGFESGLSAADGLASRGSLSVV
ncbi:hypothetical protein T492DRAFT_843720 [Pavlovales sp. CCMP2436]|nr:hypothetical protein T492DRAFT_843720 [Pavlovales sp. CCMP2436]